MKRRLSQKKGWLPKPRQPRSRIIVDITEYDSSLRLLVRTYRPKRDGDTSGRVYLVRGPKSKQGISMHSFRRAIRAQEWMLQMVTP